MLAALRECDAIEPSRLPADNRSRFFGDSHSPFHVRIPRFPVDSIPNSTTIGSVRKIALERSDGSAMRSILGCPRRAEFEPVPTVRGVNRGLYALDM